MNSQTVTHSASVPGPSDEQKAQSTKTEVTLDEEGETLTDDKVEDRSDAMQRRERDRLSAPLSPGDQRPEQGQGQENEGQRSGQRGSASSHNGQDESGQRASGSGRNGSNAPRFNPATSGVFFTGSGGWPR